MDSNDDNDNNNDNKPSLVTASELTPLEQEVLDEYERLADNMKKLAYILDNLSGSPTTQITDGLRALERSTSLVFTLLKASVYSIVLQQGIEYDGNKDADDGHAGGGAGAPRD